MDRAKEAIRTSVLSIFGNSVLAVLKGVTGYLGNSYALIADAIESTTDIFSSILVLLGLRYASRPADKNHPYGHGRAEPLITFLVVGFLVSSAALIAYKSIQHIRTPHKLPANYTLVVLLAVIIIKEVFYRITHKSGERTGSTSLKADAFHHRSDAITSLTAFVGISIALFMGPGYEAADDWAALVAAAIILYNSYKIFRPALGEIMDEQLYDEFAQTVREISLKTEGVLDTEKCHIRKAGMSYHVDLHIVVKGDISVKEGHDIAHRVKDELKGNLPEITDVLIHVEPDN